MSFFAGMISNLADLATWIGLSVMSSLSWLLDAAAGMGSNLVTWLGLSVMYSISWFLGSAAMFMLSGGRSAALRFWPTAAVLGVMTAIVHVLYSWLG